MPNEGQNGKIDYKIEVDEENQFEQKKDQDKSEA